MAKSKVPRARPAGVPDGARFNADEEQWELGAKHKGKNVGAWRGGRADGSLACETTFDGSGLLHGTFSRFHPRGGVSRAGTFSRGQHVGKESFYRSPKPSREHFTVDAESVTRVVLDHDHEGAPMHCFDARGRETTVDGVPLSEWQND